MDRGMQSTCGNSDHAEYSFFIIVNLPTALASCRFFSPDPLIDMAAKAVLMRSVATGLIYRVLRLLVLWVPYGILKLY
ncbi:hypothetical protein EDD15DRAFT_2281884, partial [Pisolithus albus]